MDNMPKQLKLSRSEVYDAGYAIRQDVKRMQRCCTKLNDDIGLLEMTMINKNEVYRLSIQEFEAWKADHDKITLIKTQRDNYLIRISRNRRTYQKMLDFADTIDSVTDSDDEEETQETQTLPTIPHEDSEESSF